MSAFLLVAGCSAESKLVGEWKNEKGTSILEFNDDGTYQLKNSVLTISGTWSVDGQNVVMVIGSGQSGMGLSGQLNDDKFLMTGKSESNVWTRVND
ncbi:MAG: hypothetical protein V4673_05965 [Pseudomonadota bacterium]